MWIDTHVHLDAAEFDHDRAAVHLRSRAAGVTRCVIPAVAAANFDTVRLMAHAQHDAYALGIHPLYTPQATEAYVAQLDAALHTHRHDPCLVAVGEIGLDGFVPELNTPEALAKQQLFYKAQLKLAQQHQLPVILHVRRSADLLLKGLRETPVVGGIAHAFNGSLQQAQAFIDLGLKLGFGGALRMTVPCSCAAWPLSCHSQPSCLKPTHPIFARIGFTPQPNNAPQATHKAATNPQSCHASRKCWPTCVAFPSKRWPKPPAPMHAKPCHAYNEA